MIDIVLSQPGTYFYPIFVLLMLAWALWTGRSRCLKRDNGLPAIPDEGSDHYRTSRGHGVTERYTSWPSVGGSLSSPLGGLHASCAADYRAIFERMKDRIKFQR